MTLFVARALLRLARACLGERHADWASAMEAELDVAAAAGEALPFALGCLTAAWRAMFTSEQGHFLLSSYALVLGMVLPMAALQIGCALFGLPYLYPDQHGLAGALLERSPRQDLLPSVYQAAIPALALLQVMIGLGHLRVGWLTLERDWAGATRWGSICLAATITLILFMAALFLDGRQVVLQGTVLAIELATIAAVARWHVQLSSGRPQVQ
ncbi:hypothetical protein [Sphingomonas sp. 22176]|uniref:hypothetical protein n=1 Tax=Sphingomonas sp. 22176 TaxID=3453884 RepID=UPI003F83D6D2